MNLCEARKLGHEGWVRSPTRTNGIWIRFNETGYSTKHGNYGTATAFDLDAEDWEPKPAPVKPFEALLWVNESGLCMSFPPVSEAGWRKVRVREVTE